MQLSRDEQLLMILVIDMCPALPEPEESAIRALLERIQNQPATATEGV